MSRKFINWKGFTFERTTDRTSPLITHGHPLHLFDSKMLVKFQPSHIVRPHHLGPSDHFRAILGFLVWLADLSPYGSCIHYSLTITGASERFLTLPPGPGRQGALLGLALARNERKRHRFSHARGMPILQRSHGNTNRGLKRGGSKHRKKRG